jgi:hypothetical protein
LVCLHLQEAKALVSLLIFFLAVPFVVVRLFDAFEDDLPVVHLRSEVRMEQGREAATAATSR